MRRKIGPGTLVTTQGQVRRNSASPLNKLERHRDVSLLPFTTRSVADRKNGARPDGQVGDTLDLGDENYP